jgi:hypothetical protein
MDFLLLATLAAMAFWQLRGMDQRQRIVLLGRHLGQYQIEGHMETLTQGYLRALGEADPERSSQIWGLLRGSEDALANQLQSFAAEFGRLDAADTRASRLPFALPFAARLLPGLSFDMRAAIAVHARGIAQVIADGEGRSRRDRAFMLSAELFLLQHTCHWFCRSRNVASARLLLRHKTAYDQVLAAVSPWTREQYLAVVG